MKKGNIYSSKHYNDLAKVIADMSNQHAATVIAHTLAKHFSELSPTFDAARWYEACWPIAAARSHGPMLPVSRR